LSTLRLPPAIQCDMSQFRREVRRAPRGGLRPQSEEGGQGRPIPCVRRSKGSSSHASGGTTVTDLAQLKPLFDAYQKQDTADVWNIHVSDQVVSPSTRRGVGRGHGKM
jgi:hypothetical protein